MKRLTLLFAVILLFTGCDATSKALSTFQETNPTIVPVGVDEDGDGLADVFVQTLDGKILVDADGKPLEVVGTREALALAKADDTLISDEILALAAVIGIPGLTYLGRLWGRAKPRQRAELWQSRFTDVVESVQEYRRKLKPKEKADMNDTVGRIHSDTQAALDDIKADNYL